MAFDGIMIAAVVHELNEALLGGRIDKVFQPERDEIVLAVRCRGATHRLILSANAGYPRLHLTWQAKDNPASAPMFCMLLRKHLAGGKITKILQPEFERIVIFTIEGFNEMGDAAQKTLVVEIMGKHSNIVLVEGGTVLDAAKHVSYSQSSVRQVLPGRPYVTAPGQGKANPLAAGREEFFACLIADKSRPAQKAIYQSFTGISPFSAGLICQMAGEPPEKSALYTAFSAVFDSVKANKFAPYIIEGHFSVFGQEVFGDDITTFRSTSQMLEYFYTEKDRQERARQKSRDLRQTVKNHIERCVKKADNYEQAIAQAAGHTALRLQGELITANIHRIQKGAKHFSCTNFYEEDMPEITIELDPELSPSENAQHYFKKYNKSKRTLGALEGQIAQNLEDLAYLEGVLQAVANSRDEADFAQIREELYTQGFVKKQAQAPKGRQPKKAKPLHYISRDGHDIFVGKNNAQNDELTLRTAGPDDIWLHTKNIPGSHVILKAKNGAVTDAAMEDAAMLAAYYSKSRAGALVPVDYCARKHVRKPKGAKPGMVIYDNHKTVFITPDEGKICKLQE